MHPIWIILKSEFWRRVRSKAFVLATLLAPIGIIALVALPGLLTFFAADSGDEPPVAVVDATEQLLPHLQEQSSSFTFVQSNTNQDALADSVRAEVYSGYLVLPDKPGLGVELAEDLEARFPYIEGHYAIQVQR